MMNINLKEKAKIGKLIYYYDEYMNYYDELNLKLGIIRKIIPCDQRFHCKRECGILIGIDDKKPECFYHGGKLIIKSIGDDFIEGKEFII